MNIGRREQFRENWSVNVGIGLAAAIWTYRVPSKCRFKFLSFGNYLGTVAAWGTAYWTLTQNGINVYPYEAIYDQIGYAAQRSTMTELEFNGGATIVITGVNPTAAILAMGVSLEWELIYQE